MNKKKINKRKRKKTERMEKRPSGSGTIPQTTEGARFGLFFSLFKNEKKESTDERGKGSERYYQSIMYGTYKDACI